MGILTCLVFPDFHLGLNLVSIGGKTGFLFDISYCFHLDYNSALPVQMAIAKIKNIFSWEYCGSTLIACDRI